MPLPAKYVPQAIRELLAFYRSTRLPGEPFSRWVDRTAQVEIVSRLTPFAEAGGNSEDTFVDWGDAETYSLKLGRGECST